MRHRIIKAVTFLVIFFFSWTSGGLYGLFNVAYAAARDNQKSRTTQKHEQRPEEKFQQAVEDIKAIIHDKLADNEKRGRLKAKRNEIESFDGEIKSQFAATEKKLKEAGLPQEILQRHYNFVKHYEDNLKELRANLDAADKTKTKEEFSARMQKVKTHLEKVAPPRRHKPLDPNKLPHRISDIKRKEPRTKPSEFLKDIKQTASSSLPAFAQKAEQSDNRPILLASNGSWASHLESLPKVEKQLSPEPLLLAQAGNPPADADLAETIDVQLTPAIRAKAQELGYSPVKIYNWVRNNVEYVPTYGSIQGADMCLQTLQGNDFDIASLLIALLRASNIHARYVYGTIELPIDKVMNWVGGFTNANAAIQFIASGGTPVVGLISGGKIVAARKEHVWVETYIKYYPLRGAAHKTGQGDSWIPLDASFKQYNYTQGIDIKTAVPFDAETFVNQIKTTATIDEANSSVTNVNSAYIQQQMQSYQEQVQAYIEQNYPDATVGDVLGKKEIIKQEFSYLLGTLPYRKSLAGVKFSEIPDGLRHKITFKVIKDIYDEEMGTALIITKRLPEIAGKKITLSYSPATANDEAVINSYLPKPHADGTPIQPSELPTSLPAYLIKLKPELRIDGEVVATGSTIGMGYQETFDMVFTEPGPGGGTDVVSSQIDAGAYHAVAINTGKIPQSQMLALKEKLEITKTKLEAGDVADLTKDDILGDILYATALTYYVQFDLINEIQSKTIGVKVLRWPSEAIFASSMKVNLFYGMPHMVTGGGLLMDVDRSLNVVASLDGDNNKVVQFMQTSGMNGSALEHAVPEMMFSTPENPVEGVSAVKALQIANNQGIPIYTVNQSNISAIMPQLQVDADVKKDIQNAVNAGKMVTVSKTNITYNGWTGCGYIITNPNTGAGAYMISGGLSGGIAMIIIGVALILFGLLVALGGVPVLGFAIELLGILFIGAGLCVISGDDRYLKAAIYFVGGSVFIAGTIFQFFAGVLTATDLLLLGLFRIAYARIAIVTGKMKSFCEDD